jgi:hypothetical protein
VRDRLYIIYQVHDNVLLIGKDFAYYDDVVFSKKCE